MRHAIWLVALGMIGACGGDSKSDSGTPTTGAATGTAGGSTTNAQHAAACAGSQSGTYTGDDAGLVVGDLAADGALTITFGTSFGDVDAVGTVDPAGVLTGSQGAVSVSGTYDLTACTASGAWTDSALGNTGTWQISRD